MSIKLYVGNLSFQTSSDELQELFAQAGTVESVTVIEDRDTGRSRGFGFVEMTDVDEAREAIAQFNGRKLNGRSLRVNAATGEVGARRRSLAPSPHLSTRRGGLRTKRDVYQVDFDRQDPKVLLSRLSVNKSVFLIRGVRTNSLTSEACQRFNVDSVDMHTSLSEFQKIDCPLIDANTYSLIYFVPDKVEVTAPVKSSTCLKLEDLGDGSTSAAVFVYDRYAYGKRDYEFSFEGVLGCTGVATLGFCLLKSLHNVRTRVLSTVTISDRAWVQKHEGLDLKVSDEIVFDFCNSVGDENLFMGAGNRDCDNWSECRGLPGVRCVHNEPNCK